MPEIIILDDYTDQDITLYNTKLNETYHFDDLIELVTTQELEEILYNNPHYTIH